MKPIISAIVRGLMMAALAMAAEADRFAPAFASGGIQVHLKMDFDEAENPFDAQGGAEVALSNRHAISGRSLHVRRKSPGGYFGGHTSQVAVRNTPQLNIAFCVRAEGMRNVAVNFYDAKRGDNTTPTSPSRVQDGIWRTVVYAVEDSPRQLASEQSAHGCALPAGVAVFSIKTDGAVALLVAGYSSSSSI